MALTPSRMLELGTAAPDFSLADTAGRTVSRSDFRGQPLLVMFICNHCPYVQHIRRHVAETCRAYRGKGVGVVAINSNDVTTHPEDRPEKMAEEVGAIGYTFPYLYDESQAVAKEYHAACTPDFFLFDREHKLVYRGQYDGSRPGNEVAISGSDLGAALDSVLAGRAPAGPQKPSMGCNIKWKAGNEPEYAGH